MLLKWITASSLILGMACSCYSAQPSLSQTQSKLKQLDAQINHIRQNLASANKKKGTLNQQLAGTEKQIGEGVRQLHTIQRTMSSKEQKITELHHKANQLNTQLTRQQHLLARHVVARYQMGEYQPLKWLLNQDDPYKVSRILTYYQFVIASRQQLIEQISETRKAIDQNKEQLHSELKENYQLKHQLTLHQKELETNKNHHTILLNSLNTEIQSTEHSLQDAQKDKDNLSRLLRSLSQHSAVVSSKPFAQMRKKLPLPVQTAHKSLRRMNQGVTFFADEGTVVTAVHPGKVVFSDWLKGYGLLLIIDHGQGFMTLYAHNQSLFKHKGQAVRQNEQVASVGHSGGIKQNGLYFEIRSRGKAVAPLDWLI